MKAAPQTRRERMLAQLERLPVADRKEVFRQLGRRERLSLRQALREWSKANEGQRASGVTSHALKSKASPYSPWVAKRILSAASGQDAKGAQTMTDEVRKLLLEVSAQVSSQIGVSDEPVGPINQSGNRPVGKRAGVAQ